MKDEAIKNFKNGYSCSESIVKAALDKGIINKDLISVATPFSGGLSSGCLCGAISGAQMVIGELYGKNNPDNGQKSRELAKKFMEKFKEINKATCCRVLTKDFDFATPERKANCENIVKCSAEILEELIK